MAKEIAANDDPQSVKFANQLEAYQSDVDGGIVFLKATLKEFNISE